MIVCGIDPGKSGGLVVLGNGPAQGILMPKDGKLVDGAGIAAFLAIHSPDIVIIEKVGAMPHDGRVSAFSFGKSTGIVIGAVRSMGIPFREVRPQVWKSLVLPRTDKDKQAAIDYISRVYPEINLIPGRCRAPQDGIADAGCIADWGLNHMKSKYGNG